MGLTDSFLFECHLLCHRVTSNDMSAVQLAGSVCVLLMGQASVCVSTVHC